jgi:hypothetical protein
MTTLLTAILVSVHGLDDRWSFTFCEDFSPTVLVSITVFMLILRGATHVLQCSLAKQCDTDTAYIWPIQSSELLRYGYYGSVQCVSPALLRF